MDNHDCKELLEDFKNFDNLCEGPLYCPKCGKMFELEYEQTWDGEEVYGWFNLVEAVEQKYANK